MSERQMTIVLLVVMGAILLIGAGALYYLRFQELATLQEQAEKLNGQVTEAKRKRDAVKGLQAKVAQLDEKIAKLLSQIPKFDPKTENDDFANLVDDLRKKCQVSVGGARYSAVRSGQPGGEGLPPSIFRARYAYKVGGGFYNLLNFINHIEAEKRFLVADSIKLSAGVAPTGSRAAPVRELQFNVSTFLQKADAPAPTAAAAPVKPGDKPVVPAEPVPDVRPSTPIPD
jgi:Tfp pilus assembly protein PilO